MLKRSNMLLTINQNIAKKQRVKLPIPILNFRPYNRNLGSNVHISNRKPNVLFKEQYPYLFSTGAYRESFYIHIMHDGDCSHDISHICIYKMEEPLTFNIPCATSHVYDALLRLIVLNKKYTQSTMFIFDFNTKHFEKLCRKLESRKIEYEISLNLLKGHHELLVLGPDILLVDVL